MAGVARMRTSRQRQRLGLTRLLVILLVAAVGGVMLWNSLQYSAAHDTSNAAARLSEQQGGLEGEGLAAADEEQQGGEDGGEADPDASLNAWTKLTDLPGKSKAGDGGDGGSSSSSRDSSEANSAGGSDSSTGSAGGGKQGGAAAAVEEGKKFLTVQLRVPQMPPTYNSWVQTEDMLLFHLKALQQQLEQTYIGLALAAATKRVFVLPELQCFCQNSEAPLPRCRRPDSDALQFPTACRDGEVLAAPQEFAADAGAKGMPLEVQPAAYLQALEAAGGPDAELVLRPSAQILFPQCAASSPDPTAFPKDCIQKSRREGEGEGVQLVPPSLNDTELLPLLEPLQKYRLWRLDFSDVGSHWHAFRGWDCAEPAHQFDLRMKQVVKPWPSPAAAAAAAAGGDAASLPLLAVKMTGGRTYSDEPDMRPTCGGMGGGGDKAAGEQAAGKPAH